MIILDICRFNSKMVRLKVSEFFDVPIGYWLFQFQNGAIKSNTFNFRSIIKSVVSIPKWCD